MEIKTYLNSRKRLYITLSEYNKYGKLKTPYFIVEMEYRVPVKLLGKVLWYTWVLVESITICKDVLLDMATTQTALNYILSRMNARLYARETKKRLRKLKREFYYNKND